VPYHKKKQGKKIKRELPENYRPALAEDVPEGRACGNCFFYNEDLVNEDRTKAWCEKWEEFVDGGFYCNAWQTDEERAAPDSLKVGDFVSWNSSGGRARGKITRIATSGEIEVPNTSVSISASEEDPAALIRLYREGSDGWEETDILVGHKFSTLTKIEDLRSLEIREVNLTPPAYMRAAARRGLELNRQGFGGDGLTDKTKREAREMAAGRVSADKWVRIAAWIARHLVDLDAPQNSDPSDSGYPGAGLVAHLLWGSGSSKSAANRTMKYAESVVERLRAEENKKRWSSVDIITKKDKEEKVSLVERRIKNNINFEIRVDDTESDGMKFSGYAAVFNSNSEPLPFTERILEGAFSRSLRSRNEVKLFKNHNMDEVLASTRSKTLRLREDSTGLLAEATLPDTTAGRDLAVLMKRGDVHSMSFGFTVPEGGDSWNSKGSVRELREVRLHEVSIVTGFPAYANTTASVRSLEILAKRSQVDEDKIADVLLKLESGETLPADEADLLVEIVDKLREEKEELKSDLTNLDLKRKELDLLFKAV
jgi:HK97 family phage prohead protease